MSLHSCSSLSSAQDKIPNVSQKPSFKETEYFSLYSIPPDDDHQGIMPFNARSICNTGTSSGIQPNCKKLPLTHIEKHKTKISFGNHTTRGHNDLRCMLQAKLSRPDVQGIENAHQTVLSSLGTKLVLRETTQPQRSSNSDCFTSDTEQVDNQQADVPETPRSNTINFSHHEPYIFRQDCNANSVGECSGGTSLPTNGSTGTECTITNQTDLNEILNVNRISWRHVEINSQRSSFVKTKYKSQLEYNIEKARKLPSNMGMILNNKIYWGKSPPNKHNTSRVTQIVPSNVGTHIGTKYTYIWNNNFYRVLVKKENMNERILVTEYTNGNLIMKKFM